MVVQVINPSRRTFKSESSGRKKVKQVLKKKFLKNVELFFRKFKNICVNTELGFGGLM